jgi:glycosyltransferase involved in cell wall biosynthesis
MDVALLHGSYWPEVRRGTERVMHELATGLVRRGHRARVITSHPGRSVTAEEDGVTVVRNRRPPDLLPLRGIQAHLTHLPLSYRSLRRGADDLAYALHPTDALAALHWRERTGRPVVLGYMGLPQRQVLSSQRGRMRMLWQVVNEADAIVTLSRAAADAMRRWLVADSHVIHPGVDLERFAPGGARAAAPTVVCAGDPDDDRKRVPLLLEGFARLRREMPDARLVIAARVKDPRTAARVGGLPGVEVRAVDSAGVADAYRSAWVTALVSHSEAFGLVHAESLACGTPVVGCDDGGTPEIVDDPGLGRLVPRDPTPEDVARALREALDLARDPATPDRCRASAERWSADAATERYLTLFSALRDRR